VRAMKYRKGMHELADGVWAYLQPDGGWGWSNAGLITDHDRSLLVDTLFDLKLTGEMLDAMRRTTPAANRIDSLVNTHANGDHWFGNSLVEGADIIASARAAAEMLELPPDRFAQLMKAAPGMGETGAFLARVFGSFDFDGIDAAHPNRTFSGTLDLAVGERRVSLIEVGPAHTAGDVVVHLPDEGVVFTGDILFHGGHPIVWAGPVSNWIAACDRILALTPLVVVPGHGPLAGPQAVADLKGYFEYLTVETRRRFDAGMGATEAAHDIDLGPYSDWSEDERVVVNVGCLYREFGAGVAGDAGNLMDHMAAWEAER
jgi:cyclase